MALVLDIETVGQSVDEIPERALEYLFRGLERDEPEPEELERRRADLIDRFGLDPTTGRVVCVGTVDSESGEQRAFADRDEQHLLEAFWSFLSDNGSSLFVTFNGKRFDIPYLNLRSAILGLRPRRVIPSQPESVRPHFDVREVIAGEDRRRRGSLDYFCSVFGIDSPKTELDGSKVAQAFAEGRIDEITRYCLADCRATAALFQRLAPFYL